MRRATVPTAIRALAASAALLVLGGCSTLSNLNLPFFSHTEPPKPAELQPNPNLIGVRQAWSAHIGKVDFPLVPAASGNTVTVAGADGTVAVLDATNGHELWRASAGAPLTAGVGSDGKTAAVVTRNNDLVALAGGKVLWREKLLAQSYTPPLVAGARVFVLAGDRSVSAYDGATGRRLWNQQRPGGEPLVLREPGVLLAVGDTLVVGQGGRLAGLNPLNGIARWEVPIGTSRGIDDIERLVDLVGRASRVGDSVCARAFQVAVGCVDAARGAVVWTQKANGSEGLAGDGADVFGTESDGHVVAWRRDNGQRAWSSDKLLHRGLGTPLALGRSVIVGDSFGYVHMLSRQDGSLLNRLSTDGSAIAAAPVVAANTLVVVTRNGGVFGFVPQ
jgi:outer membrane assembly lipoprotein YfgL